MLHCDLTPGAGSCLGPSVLPAGLWVCLQQRTAPWPPAGRAEPGLQTQTPRAAQERHRARGQWGADRTVSPSPEARPGKCLPVSPTGHQAKRSPPLPRAALGDTGVPGCVRVCGHRAQPRGPTLQGSLASVCRCEDSDPMNQQGY